MRNFFLSFGIVLALLVMFFATTAFTNTPTVHAATLPHKVGCIPGWRTSGYTLVSRVDTPDGSPETIINNTNQTVTRTVSTTQTYTVSATVSYSQDVSFTQLAATEKASVGISVQGTITIAKGESTSVPVGPYKSVRYGDYIRVDTFLYDEYYLNTDCSTGADNGYLRFSAPEMKFWTAINV